MLTLKCLQSIVWISFCGCFWIAIVDDIFELISTRFGSTSYDQILSHNGNGFALKFLAVFVKAILMSFGFLLVSDEQVW